MMELYFYYNGRRIIVTSRRPATGYFCRDFDFFEQIFLSLQCPSSGVYWCSTGLSDRALFQLFKRKGLHKCVVSCRHVPLIELPDALRE